MTINWVSDSILVSIPRFRSPTHIEHDLAVQVLRDHRS